jgi:hypothetical protein
MSIYTLANVVKGRKAKEEGKKELRKSSENLMLFLCKEAS